MKKKNYVSKAVMLGALLAPIGMPTVSVLADSFYQNQTSAHAADITNWIASTPEQITNNLTTQNINPQQLDGQQYVIQWGDTLWGNSQATGISIEKLAYDNNIQNIDLIFAGDVLILKRDGDVPAGYHVTGNGYRCAHSKIVINNYYGDYRAGRVPPRGGHDYAYRAMPGAVTATRQSRTVSCNNKQLAYPPQREAL